MPILVPVKYHGRNYPQGITPRLREVPAHLDVEAISPEGAYCLHTEYSASRRSLESPLLETLPTIRESHRRGIPQLWRSERWADEFADFIFALTEGSPEPSAVEIHPPFNDYCGSIEQFLLNYSRFENRLRSHCPGCDVLLENRSGTRYSGGSFLISSPEDVARLATQAAGDGLELGIALDAPQLLTSLGGPQEMSAGQITRALADLQPVRRRIRGIHLWGKKRNSRGWFTPHIGSLDDYFDEDQEKKEAFLEGLKTLLDDDAPRLFVPEVNSSNDDLASIVKDLLARGFEFHAKD